MSEGPLWDWLTGRPRVGSEAEQLVSRGWGGGEEREGSGVETSITGSNGRLPLLPRVCGTAGTSSSSS